MSVLRDLQERADPALAEHAVPEPGKGAFEGLVPDANRALVIEAVREGFELHYGKPRAFEGMDEDLELLAGDALYALGLARLAEHGDLEAVAELADLITNCAKAEAEGRGTEPLWRKSVATLANG